MKKLVILLILLAAVIFTAGCTEKSQGNITNTQAVPESNGVVEPNESGQNTTLQETQEVNNVVEGTSLEQINASLQQGPVFMKLETEDCGTCQAMKPMIRELATEYKGRVSFISVDIGKSTNLTKEFSAYNVPDISVIMNIKDGKYVYMQQDGNVTTDRSKARIVGSMEKGIYENVLNLALLKEGKSTS